MVSVCDRSTPSTGPSKGTLVSNPVAPPPPTNEGAAPPPADQGFGAAPAAPPAGPPAPGQPQQGFGDAPATFPVAPVKKKNAALKIVLRIVLIIVIAIVGYVVKDALFGGDKAKNAAVGDCVAAPKNVAADKETEVDAEVVDCTSDKAAYTVKGRVNGETSTSSKSCDKFFKENDEYYVYSSDAGKGYLLCLKPKA
jgi:hypothetical protein